MSDIAKYAVPLEYQDTFGVMETQDGKRWLTQMEAGGIRVIRALLPGEGMPGVPQSTQSSPSPVKTPIQHLEEMMNLQATTHSAVDILQQLKDWAWKPDDGSVVDAAPGTGFGEVKDHMLADKQSRGMEKDFTVIDKVFRHMLSNIMLDNMYDRMVRNRRRGKLDMKHLWRAQTGVTNVFALKEAKKGKKYNVVMVIDESGSMGGSSKGSRITVAAELCAFLGKSFHDLNLNLGVIGFGSKVHTHKDFNTTFTTDDYDKLRHDMPRTDGGGTDDLGGMKRAYEMLQTKHGEQNIIIMMSDGESSNNAKIHHLIEGNKGLAHTLGIGIGVETGQIPANIMIKNLEDMKPQVLGYLRKTIRRG